MKRNESESEEKGHGYRGTITGLTETRNFRKKEQDESEDDCKKNDKREQHNFE